MNREDYRGGLWETNPRYAVGAPHDAAPFAPEPWDISSRTLPREEFTPHPQPSADKVVMPNHYGRHSIEPIRFSVENYGPGFLVGNIIKYLARYDAKDGHKDLAKAARYLEMLRLYEAGVTDWYAPRFEPDALKDWNKPGQSLRTLGGKAPSNG